MKMINVKSDDNSLPSIAASQKDGPNLKEEVPDCEEPRSSNDDGQKD